MTCLESRCDVQQLYGKAQVSQDALRAIRPRRTVEKCPRSIVQVLHVDIILAIMEMVRVIHVQETCSFPVALSARLSTRPCLSVSS